MNALLKLFYAMKHTRRMRYFKRKYGGRLNSIYYDPRYRCYINPKNLNEVGDLAYVCAETVRGAPQYTYFSCGEEVFAHSLGEVYLAAYNESEIFDLDRADEWDEWMYSRNQAEFIRRLVAQGLKDRNIAPYNRKS